MKRTKTPEKPSKPASQAAADFSSELVFLPRLPLGRRLRTITDPSKTLLIYDRKLLSAVPGFAKWARLFPHRFAVTSGEELKSLEAFPSRFQALARKARNLSPKTMTVLACGGGTVGDFAGFFASVYKRGVRLTHMPSTWIAAVDSSHGGKTALNAIAKNQLGSFYPAQTVVLVRELLESQPQARAREAMAELAKIALIDDGAWVRDLLAARKPGGASLLWRFLKPAIGAKMKFVALDPGETRGARQVLNLGHTVGHVLETAHGWPHGKAVAHGLAFALKFSESRGILRENKAAVAWKLYSQLVGPGGGPRNPPKISRGRFLNLLRRDKKIVDDDRVIFIFVEKAGRVRREGVSVADILAEARRQGLVS